MSFYPQRPTVATVLRSFGQADGLAINAALTEQVIREACAQENVHFGAGADDIYTPAVTLWAFLAQCLSASKSCVAAVARVLVLRVALGLPPCGAGSGAGAGDGDVLRRHEGGRLRRALPARGRSLRRDGQAVHWRRGA